MPQGSCLGPLLFTIYSSNLFEVIKDNLPVAHAYADGTQLHLSFKLTSSSQFEAIEAMELCIKAIRAWMITDKLKLNDDKTEFLILVHDNSLAKFTSRSYQSVMSALFLLLLQEILKLGLIPTSAW